MVTGFSSRRGRILYFTIAVSRALGINSHFVLDFPESNVKKLKLLFLTVMKLSV
jgi:hypothetical protein